MQFIKNTSYSKRVLGLIIKLSFVIFIVLGVIFFLNKIDFPAPNKEIEKIIPNENFKIVK
jgi:hypothetical protein